MRATRPHHGGFLCCLMFFVTHAVVTTPAEPTRLHRSSACSAAAFAHAPRLGFRITCFEASRRLLTLRPACSLNHRVILFLECFSPIRYLLEPPQVLPAGATICRAGFAPARTTNLTQHTVHGQECSTRCKIQGQAVKEVTRNPPRDTSPANQFPARLVASVGATERPKRELLSSGGRYDECRLDLSKSIAQNAIGKKGLTCVDGVLATQPSLARRPKDGIF